MKNDNYEPMLDRYYSGKATAEEARMLNEAGLIDNEDELYASAVQEERAVNMNWSFEEMMQATAREEKPIIKPKIVWMNRFAAAAAILAICFLTYTFLYKKDEATPLADVPAKREQKIAQPILQADTAISIAVATVPKKTVIITQANRKKTKLIAAVKGPLPAALKVAKTDYDPNMVVVNGKPIASEEDALAITKESMAMLSRNLTNSIEELKPISTIKIKF